jgi:hypothetical protein
VPKPLLSARYRVVVRDAQGRIKYIEEAPSKSFILNFLYVWWLCFNLNTTNSVSVTSPSGVQTTMTTTQPLGWGNWVNGAGKPYTGIQVGSGTLAPSASSPYLESLILSGSGTGQLSYSSDTVTSPSISSNPATLQVTKTFANNSGGSVTVGEIGLAPQLRNDAAGQYQAALMVHDVLSSAASVPNGGTITVTYTLQVNT